MSNRQAEATNVINLYLYLVSNQSVPRDDRYQVPYLLELFTS